MQLQNEIVKKHTPIKSLLIDWLIIFGTYLFIRIFFALFGLHQNIVLLGCCLAILPYLFGALYLQKSHKQAFIAIVRALKASQALGRAALTGRGGTPARLC